MSKIVFIEKHLNTNLPEHQLKLFDWLVKKGNDLEIVTFDKSLKSRELYKNFNINTVSNSTELEKTVSLINPDKIFFELTTPHQFPSPGPTHALRRFVGKNRKKYEFIELDSRSTEILSYGRQRQYPGQYSVFPSFRTLGFFKAALKNMLNSINLYDKRYDTQKATILSDKICLRGLWWKKRLRDFFPELNQSIFPITGSTLADSIYEKGNKPFKLDERFNIDEDKDLIVACPFKMTGEVRYTKYYNNLLLKSLSKLEEKMDANIVMKLHPNDLRRIENGEIKPFTDKYPLCPTDKFYNILNKSKLVISQGSSVGIESAILDTPHVNLNTNNIFKYTNKYYLNKGLNIGISVDKSTLVAGVKGIFNNEINFDFDNFRKYFHNGVDLKSHINVGRQILRANK